MKKALKFPGETPDLDAIKINANEHWKDNSRFGNNRFDVQASGFSNCELKFLSEKAYTLESAIY